MRVVVALVALEEVILPLNSRMANRLVPSVRRIYAEVDSVIAFFDASGTTVDGLPYANSYV